MEVIRTLLDVVFEILRYPLHFCGFTFTMFGVAMVAVAGTIVGIVLKAIFGDD